MADFSDMFIASQSWELQQRITMAILRVAPEVINRGDTVPAAERQLAFRVARAAQTYTQPFTMLLAAQDITNASSDADIYNRVNEMWKVLAYDDGTPESEATA